MKKPYGPIGIALAIVIGFYAFNSYIYKQKQGDTSMKNTQVKIIPVSHASLALTWGDKILYADPVGKPELYASIAKPDIVLITHEHGDHFNSSTLTAIMGAHTKLITPQIIADKLPNTLKDNVIVLKNGDTTNQGGLTVQAVPMYNLREEDKNRHKEGSGNGYVLEGGGTRVYIAGDTEDIPEMRTLQNIDIAFVPMNLPYTMSVEKAAEAVLAFKPKQVYPYHYRTPTGLSDVAKFKELVNAGNPNIEVIQLNWYPQ